MENSFEITINGHQFPVVGSVANRTLLDFLLDSGFTTLRRPRGVENLGTDAVILLDLNAWGRPAYRLVPSSLIPLGQAARRRILTVEALLASSPTHPVVEILRKHAPHLPAETMSGIYLAFFEAWYRDGLESVQQVEDGYAGFAFRFGGFRSLSKAALELYDRVSALRAKVAPQFELSSPEAMASLRMRGVTGAIDPFDDAFSAALRQAAPVAEPVSYQVAGTDEGFYRRGTLGEMRKLREKVPNVAEIHSGVASLRREGATPLTTISAEGATELRTVMHYDGKLEIGGEATLTMLEESLGNRFPELVELIPKLEPRAVRNRLTLTEHLLEKGRPPGLALPAILADAQIRVAATDTEHDASITGFFRTRSESGLRPNELVKKVEIARELKGAINRSFSQVYWFKGFGAAGFSVDVDADGQIVSAKAASVGFDKHSPFKRSGHLESALVGKFWGTHEVLRAGSALTEEFQAKSDRFASAEHRAQLLMNAWRRFHREFRSRETHEARLPISVPPPPVC